MGTNRPSNQDAPRVPGEEGSRGTPWGKIIAALIGLLLLAILIPLACQALRGSGDQGSGGARDSGEATEEAQGAGGGTQGDGDAQGGGDGGGAAGETNGSGDGNAAQEEGAGREVSGEIAGIESRGGDGTSVTIPRATISGAGGWIAVRSDDGGNPGAVIGQAPIRDGESTSVEVPLDESLSSTQRLYAVLHVEDPADGEFTFPDGDPPLDTTEQASATEPFRYAVSEASSEQAVTRNGELPESGGVPPNVVPTIGVAMLLVGFALMRGASRKRQW